MIRLTRSYRGAMASNISRTARFFSSPSGSVSVSQELLVVTGTRLPMARFDRGDVPSSDSSP